MIDFGCKKFDIKEILKCALGLTRAECDIFMFFLNNSTQNFTTIQISKILRLNLSTVQKGVKKLNEKKILIKYQQNLENGGYFFVYEVNCEDVVKSQIISIIQNWSDDIINRVKKSKLKNINEENK